jgi:hypothetical protein
MICSRPGWGFDGMTGRHDRRRLAAAGLEDAAAFRREARVLLPL